MSFENFKYAISEKLGDLSDVRVTFPHAITTQDEVDELIRILSNDQLKIYSISINIGDDVADYFIKKFSAMQPRPTIVGLELPSINLSHDSWQQFFTGMAAFKELKFLALNNSNFDYSNDLGCLAEYLAANPALEEIDIRHVEKMGDKTFLEGASEKKLLDSLQPNTHLTSFKYGDRIFLGSGLDENLSDGIIKKLARNKSQDVSRNETSKFVAKCKDVAYQENVKNKLDHLVMACIEDALRVGTKDESKIVTDVFGMPLSTKMLIINLTDLSNVIKSAISDKAFKESVEGEHIKQTFFYYYNQSELLDALTKMYQQEMKASDHDKSILHNLREDLLKQWKKAATTDGANRHNNMSNFIQHMINRCENQSSQVKDKSSGALIKNIMLILGAVLTAGIALGIYAAFTTQSRAESGSFFFKDTELSKDKITEVKTALEEIKKYSPK